MSIWFFLGIYLFGIATGLMVVWIIILYHTYHDGIIVIKNNKDVIIEDQNSKKYWLNYIKDKI